MVTLNRRKFLSALSCLAITSTASNTDILSLLDNSKADINDFEQIRNFWHKNEATSASTFLSSRGVDANSSKEHIKSLVVKDFKQDNTIVINGLVLSKTEAAVIVSATEYV